MRIRIIFFKLICHIFLSLRALCICKVVGIVLVPQAAFQAMGHKCLTENQVFTQRHYTLTSSKAPYRGVVQHTPPRDEFRGKN